MDKNPILINDCPRCGVNQITFEILAEFHRNDWELTLFGVCRGCWEGSTFEIEPIAIRMSILRESIGGIANPYCNKITLQSPKFGSVTRCPEFVPAALVGIFEEGTASKAIGCHSASGAMFRKVIDQATRTLVDAQPGQENGNSGGISWKEFKDLRLRLDWLIRNKKLPEDMAHLVECVREDGNDAAHALETIGENGSADLEDFSKAILEHLFTMPGKITRNIHRRAGRRDTEAETE